VRNRYPKRVVRPNLPEAGPASGVAAAVAEGAAEEDAAVKKPSPRLSLPLPRRQQFLLHLLLHP
jgi:hypothetical protein